MSLFNEILEGRYNLILNKLLGIKSGAPAPQLSSDVQAGFTLESDAPEWAALAGTRLCWGQGQVAAGGAGNRSQIALSNPANSGMLCRVELIMFASTAAIFGAPIRTGNNIGAFGTSATVGVRDSRLQQVPACVIRTANGFAVGGSLRTVLFPDFSAAGVFAGRLQDVQALISPGQNLQLDPGNDNQDFQVTYWWRERAANPAELTLGA